ncbi:MAG TPA: serine/threonine-protein kinase [Ktedonobacteraceae bacterium]|nr:serine/threonine-protein kinase [Ktedonobacteraceae bacterium]
MQEIRETLPSGSLVHDRYLVEKMLGRGGFGAVYLVRDQRVRQNLFALKEVIDPNKRERERFTFEAELLKRVDHPSLPRVYRVFKDDRHDRAYMLMDYIDGPNLEQLRRRQVDKRFSVQQVLSIMGPIMDALSYLHDQQPPIIHRDIKPSNIIVPTTGDEAVLVDFGIAKEFDPESTTTAIRHASPGYGAPEQYGIGTNTRTDIYGLGATMYALLTGVVPTDAFYRITQKSARGRDPLEPIQRYAPNVPQHIADAIYRALAVDMDERFPTVKDFWRALSEQTPVEAEAAPAVAPIELLSRPAEINTPVPLPGVVTTIAMSGGPRNGRRSRRRLGAWLLLLLVLLIGILSAALFLPALLAHHAGQTTPTPTAKATHRPVVTVTHAPTPLSSPGSATTPATSPTSTPNPTPTPSPVPGYPVLAKQYNGTIHNTPANLNASMTLNAIQQNRGNIQGRFLVSSPLLGSGPFTGTVNTSGALQFIVSSSQVAPLFFQGSIRGDGSLAGTYCSLNRSGHCDPAAGGYGSWLVYPLSSGAGS